jgi:hypothetical protein
MKKVMCLAILIVAGLVLMVPVPAQAGGSRVYFGVNVGVGPGYWGPGYWGAGYWGPRYWGPGYWGPRYWGPRVWWGPSAWWGGPYYYPAPAAVVQQPPVYVQPAPPPEEPQYWYYCQSPQGYYPYVKQCPKGWMKVVPPTTPPGQ